MDKSKVREIVQETAPWLIWALQLQDWNIQIAYETLASENTATGFHADAKIDKVTGSQRALITLDHDALHTRQQVLGALGHELLHIFHQGFDLYGNAVDAVAPDTAAVILERVFYDAREAMVRRVERMLSGGLCLDWEAVIAQAKERAAGFVPKGEVTEVGEEDN